MTSTFALAVVGRRPQLTGGADIVAGRHAIGLGPLLLSVVILAGILVLTLVVWRYRRLKLRAGESQIEYFAPRDDSPTDGV